ncbi:SDR family oxidoreductase [Ramlibacter sp. WS9]|uniref:SDR family oxidoreductase n=1 Tax=Ramlibacter sp. WS9 TaxID=1882741 RepID=UPI001141D523|nr:SDR family oxidoreductase [Ramlibacter sp. WS9]ROZ75025.1 SDR family oxidoreductase [Ramlibacter sp. WS9]
MSGLVKGRRVLVTAGASGLGLEIARAFVRAGDTVAVCDMDENALRQLSERGEDIHGIRCDVADREGCVELIRQTYEALGGLDVLVNNAGMAGPTGQLDEIDPGEWDRTVAVNLTGTFNVTRAAIPWLKQHGSGAIINIGSTAGRMGFPNRSAYAATKWAIVGLTKTLAIDLGPWGVRVNAVLPGAVDGERFRNVIADKARLRGVPYEEVLREVLAGMSIKRLVPPQEVAALVAFLASPDTSTLSGQAVSIDGDTQTMA